ncbi:threonine/homoserine/homoserine lactone efflux protein [Micromonospora pisi]|uniref:Threonine/homoserine/homoserine lactone efflux protein n=1 Tax=Micromonospora pisi TaxID=589240 RepID=A0A495JRA6_9ACTN|nr:LysE family translocator [Micromonospora pisi]RKR91371.1 threonine/homoserine/homoserine lactone efflux protein [Micromonospora pisi]
MINTLAVFLGTCLLLAMVPGPGAAVIFRQAVGDGRRSAFMTMLGNETALVIWGIAAACGLTALVTASQLAYDTMRIVGAGVLIWLGVQALLSVRRGESTFAPPSGTDPGRSSGWRSYRTGLIANLTNPKAAVFAMSFLPQFVPGGLPVLPTVVLLAVLWAVMDALWFSGVIWFIGRARSLFDRSVVRRRLTQFSGAVLIALGLRLVTE